MAFLSGKVFVFIMFLGYLKFKKISSAFALAVSLFFILGIIVTIGNTYDQYRFYSDADLENSSTIVAAPKLTLGNSLNPAHFLKATLKDNGTYSCEGINPINPKYTTMSVSKASVLYCCNHDESIDGYQAPYKIEKGKLHVLCGTFPKHNEVVTDIPDGFRGMSNDID